MHIKQYFFAVVVEKRKCKCAGTQTPAYYMKKCHKEPK